MSGREVVEEIGSGVGNAGCANVGTVISKGNVTIGDSNISAGSVLISDSSSGTGSIWIDDSRYGMGSASIDDLSNGMGKCPSGGQNWGASGNDCKPAKSRSS